MHSVSASRLATTGLQAGVLAAALALTACSAAPAPSATSSPTASGAAAAPSCPPTPSPLGCTLFVSTGGNDATGERAWLAGSSLGFRLRAAGGRTVLEVSTPCNAISVDVTATATRLIPDPDTLVSGTLGCLGAAGAQEQWARTLVSAPLTIEGGSAPQALTGSGRTVTVAASNGWTLSR